MTGGAGHEGGTPSATPWIETPGGGWFFVNSLLVAPAFIVLFSLGMERVLAAAGASPYLLQAFGVFPALARYVVPVAGWLLVIPAWTTYRNLELVGGGAARSALVAYLATHLGFLAYAAWFWITGQSFPEVTG